MRGFIRFIPILIILSLTMCQTKKSDNMHPGENEIAVSFEVVSNMLEGSGESEMAFTFRNNGSVELTNSGWIMFYNSLSGNPLKGKINGPIKITHITGDYLKLEPEKDFSLKPGEELRITYRSNADIINYTLSVLNPYFVFHDEDGNELSRWAVKDFSTVPWTKPEQSNRSESDKIPIPTPEIRYERDKDQEILAEHEIPMVVPTPSSVKTQSGIITVNDSFKIQFEQGLEKEAAYLTDFLSSHLSLKLASSPGKEKGGEIISLSKGLSGSKAEGYKLSLDNINGIQIKGNDGAGVFYGIQSLISLIPVEEFQYPSGSFGIKSQDITDAPAFGYRGIHFDIARNFNSKGTIKKMLDIMGFYKLNVLHLHLTDDEGWRLEIEELPELTEIGAFRGHTTDEKDHLYPAYGSGPEPDPKNSYGSGYFTREDFKEILRYADDRHIEVIPEFNFPAHARAAIKSMEVRYERFMAEGQPEKAEEFRLIDPEDQSKYNSAQNYSDNVSCVCRESVFNFYTTVVDDVIEMYKEAGAPLKIFHTGGDEVPYGSWQGSPMCEEFLKERPELGEAKHLQAYFVDRARELLKERGLITAGWEEIVMKKLDGGGWEPIARFAENQDVIPYVWNNLTGWEDLGNRMLNAGFPVVLCDVGNLYFDLAYYKEGEEPGHSWGGFVATRDAFQFVPYNVYMSTKRDNMGNEFDYDTHFKGMERLKPEARKNVLGLQGQLWSETIKGGEMLEYYYLPKMLGLAERAWAGQPGWASIKEKSKRELAEDEAWNVFANTLGQRELPRLDKIFGGYSYRIPLPGAIVKNGSVHATIQYPGLTIKYTTDESEPDMISPVYENPIEATGTVKLKAFNSVGRGSRTSRIER